MYQLSRLGNLTQFYSRHGLAWHFEMVKKYGRVFKFYGFFGVSTFCKSQI
jgi:hypothetical protein